MIKAKPNRARRVRAFLAANRVREAFVRKHKPRFTRVLRTDLQLVLRTLRAGRASPQDIQKALRSNEGAWLAAQRDLFLEVWKHFGNAVWHSLSKLPRKAAEPAWVSLQSLAADEHLATQGAQRIRDITDTTRKAVSNMARRGFDEGLSGREIEDNIRGMGVFKESRIETIVRTETGVASNMGSQAAAKATGIPLKKEWITVADTRVRGGAKPKKSKRKSKKPPKRPGSNHKKMNGKKIPLAQQWAVPRGDGKGNDQMMYPMDSSAGARADAIINCRCVEGYIPDSSAPAPVAPKPTAKPRLPRKPAAGSKPKPATTATAGKGAGKRGAEVREEILRDLGVKQSDIDAVANRKAHQRAVRLAREKGDSAALAAAQAEMRKSSNAYSSAKTSTAQSRNVRETRAKLAVEGNKARVGYEAGTGPFDDKLKPVLRNKMKDARDFVRSITSSKLVVKPIQLQHHGLKAGGRAWARPDFLGQRDPFKHATVAITEREKIQVIVHEIGHTLEFWSPRTAKATKAFRARRTKLASGKVAKKKPLGKSYGKDEVFLEDDFHSDYVGKVYDGNSTEVLSMGVERLYADPVGFMLDDPDYFDFMIDLLRGHL